MSDTVQCSHCGVFFHVDEDENFVPIFDAEDLSSMSASVCPRCRKTTIKVDAADGGVIVYPKMPSRKAIPAEVTPSCAADYREACLVLGDSQKASAALSRRCLQSFLREVLRVKPSSLDREIQEVLDSRKLPDGLASDLDAVRAIGNFAVHPMKSVHTGEILDVEPGEAAWLVEILGQLFEWVYVQHPRQQAHHEALNRKLEEAGKPPLKDGLS